MTKKSPPTNSDDSSSPRQVELEVSSLSSPKQGASPRPDDRHTSYAQSGYSMRSEMSDNSERRLRGVMGSRPEFGGVGSRWRQVSRQWHYRLGLLSVLLGVTLGLAFHMAFGGKVEVPLGVPVGLSCMALMDLLPKLVRRLASAFGLHRHGSGLLKQKLVGAVGTCMYLAPSKLTSVRTPLPELDLHPLLGIELPHWTSLVPEGAKDWFCLLQKASVDTLSAHDIAVAPAQQVAFLLCPLVLHPDFHHLKEQLANHLARDSSLAFHAFCLHRSRQDQRRSGRWLREAIQSERWQRYSRCVEFYETLSVVPLPCEGRHVAPKDCVSPFCGEALLGRHGAVLAASAERRFSTGHGPTLLRLEYSSGADAGSGRVPPWAVKPGDAAEARVEGAWRAGVISAVRDGTADFRQANGVCWEGVPLSNLRPWPERFLVKPDCVANDAAVVALFRLFNYLWRYSFIPAEHKPCALDFEVLPAGPNFGFLEFVEGSIPAHEFHWDRLLECNEQQLQVFLRTAAGSIVAGHVLGIGDRHQDNILLRSTELPDVGPCVQFFQVDFKHCLGKHTRIDAPSIAIPYGMKVLLHHMADVPLHRKLSDRDYNNESQPSPEEVLVTTSNRWNELKALCGMAFRVLRRSNGFIVHLCRLLMRSPDMSAEAIETFLTGSLQLSCKEDEAVENLCKQIEESPHLLAKKVKDLSHSVSGMLH